VISPRAGEPRQRASSATILVVLVSINLFSPRVPPDQTAGWKCLTLTQRAVCRSGVLLCSYAQKLHTVPSTRTRFRLRHPRRQAGL